MTPKLEIRQFNIKEANWISDRNVLSNLRRLVFIIEQNVPQEAESDGQDEDSWHWMATSPQDQPIGTARLLPSGQIGRIAVLKECRGLGIGKALLEQAVGKARHLGFESVFLNALSHALDFYRNSGFVPEGEEFLEAGIVHCRMTLKLEPIQTHTQRKMVTGPAPDVSIRNFVTYEVDWASYGSVIRSIRRSVLVNELGLPLDTVEDEADASAIHFQAQTPDGQMIGVIRMDITGNLSRLAVDAAFRHQGTGAALLEAVHVKAQRFGLAETRLVAPVKLHPFCQKAGYSPGGEQFAREGLAHQEYSREIVYENVYQHERIEISGNPYEQDTKFPYKLGKTEQFLLLRLQEEFQRVILEMCRQATHSIRILSPVLDHKLFDSDELQEICSTLARRNRHTTIEILLHDSHRVVKHGHALLEISRKLPSSVGIKIVDPELLRSNHEFVLVDGAGVIYRQDYDLYEGYANFRDIPENNRLGRQFRKNWDFGLYDPHLRQLKM